MKCPRCIVDLAEGDVADFVAWGCRRCGGVWLDNEGSQRLAGGLDAEALKGFAAHEAHATATVEDTPARLGCPACGETMGRSPVADGVEVDTCAEHGTWLDRGEIAAITKAVAPEVMAQAAPPAMSGAALAAAATPAMSSWRGDPWLVMAVVGAALSAALHLVAMVGVAMGPMVLMLCFGLFVVFIVAVMSHPLVKRRVDGSGITYSVSWRDGLSGTPFWLKGLLGLSFLYCMVLFGVLDLQEGEEVTVATMTAAESAYFGAALLWSYLASAALRWSRGVILGLWP